MASFKGKRVEVSAFSVCVCLRNLYLTRLRNLSKYGSENFGTQTV